MSSRKVREMLRQRRIEHDRLVEEGRKYAQFEGMTKAQLIQYAEEKGIKVDKAAKKAEILKTIKE